MSFLSMETFLKKYLSWNMMGESNWCLWIVGTSRAHRCKRWSSKKSEWANLDETRQLHFSRKGLGQRVRKPGFRLPLLWTRFVTGHFSSLWTLVPSIMRIRGWVDEWLLNSALWYTMGVESPVRAHWSGDGVDKNSQGYWSSFCFSRLNH